MAMYHGFADTILDDYLITGTANIWLHTGAPGDDGDANVAQVDDGGGGTENIDMKTIAFGAAADDDVFTEGRKVTSNADVTWAAAEIDSGQTITHFSIWDNEATKSCLFIEAVTTSKETGSDGATLESGSVVVALEVFAEPV